MQPADSRSAIYEKADRILRESGRPLPKSKYQADDREALKAAVSRELLLSAKKLRAVILELNVWAEYYKEECDTKESNMRQ